MSHLPPPMPQAPHPNKHGCFFYGCLTTLVLLIVLAVGGYLTYRYLVDRAMAYTQSAPMALPKVDLPPKELAALQARADKFFDAIEKQNEQAVLVLNEKELNALIGSADTARQFKDSIYLSIEGDQIKGQISLPLEKFLSSFKGRYLNGEAAIKVSLANGVLIVTMQSVKVGNKAVPEEAMQTLRQQNLAKDAYKDVRTAEKIRKLESITVKDGSIIVLGRDPAKVK